MCSYEQPEQVSDELQRPGDQREAEHGETEAAVQQPRHQARRGGGRGRAVAAGAGVGVASVCLDSRRGLQSMSHLQETSDPTFTASKYAKHVQEKSGSQKKKLKACI